jgi:hypothetical protein
MVDFLHSSQFAVGNVQVLRRSSELHAVTFRERAFHFLIHRHTRESARIVALMFAILTCDSDAILLCILLASPRFIRSVLVGGQIEFRREADRSLSLTSAPS